MSDVLLEGGLATAFYPTCLLSLPQDNGNPCSIVPGWMCVIGFKDTIQKIYIQGVFYCVIDINCHKIRSFDAVMIFSGMNLNKFCVEKIQEWKLAVLQKKKITSAFVLEPIFPDFGHIWLSFLCFQWFLSFSADKHSKEGSSEDWTNKNTQSKWYSRSWEREIAVNSARNGDYISGFARKLVAETKSPPPEINLYTTPNLLMQEVT